MRVCLRPLRSDAVDVAGEHGAFFDVGDAEEACRDTLESDSEAAVRGHAVYLRASLSPRLSALPLCASLAPQARISSAPHGISAPDRAHPCQP